MPLRNPTEQPRWPRPAATVADSELHKAKLAETAERRGAFSKSMDASQTLIESAQVEVLKGTLERGRDSAKSVQTSASAIAVLYTGVVGLVFASDKGNPLPVRGVITVLFLGAAIALSTAFLGWPSRGPMVRPFPSGTDATLVRADRMRWLNEWVSAGTLSKAWRLKTATLCLVAGVVFLPAALIPVSSGSSSSDRPSGTETTQVPWPQPEDQGSARLTAILYEAMVDEAVSARAASATAPVPPSETTVDEVVIWVAAVVVGLVIALIGILERRRDTALTSLSSGDVGALGDDGST